MSLQVRCPNAGCGKVSTVPDEFQGKSVRCRSCRGKFRVNEAVTARETVAASRTAAEAAAAATAGPTPQRVGRFELRRRLGAGAFGEVWLAHDPQLRRDVALKVPHAELSEQPRVLERFLR